MKDVYIIQGRHPVAGGYSIHDPAELPRIVKLHQKASRTVTQELIQREGVERVFLDGLSPRYAVDMNQILEGDLQSGSPLLDHDFYMGWIETVKASRGDVSNIQFSPTEARVLDFPFFQQLYNLTMAASVVQKGVPFLVKEILRREKGESIDDALDRLDELNFPEIGKALPLKVLDMLRERAIYRNVERHGSLANLLWMGSEHALKDFYGKRSRMRVVGVQLNDDFTFDLKAVNRKIPAYLPGLVTKSLERTLGEASN